MVWSAPPCCICYEELTESLVTFTACGHIFHEECITHWLKGKAQKSEKKCPLCRANFNQKTLIKLQYQLSREYKPAGDIDEIISLSPNTLRMRLSHAESLLVDLQASSEKASTEAAKWKLSYEAAMERANESERCYETEMRMGKRLQREHNAMVTADKANKEEIDYLRSELKKFSAVSSYFAALNNGSSLPEFEQQIPTHFSNSEALAYQHHALVDMKRSLGRLKGEKDRWKSLYEDKCKEMCGLISENEKLKKRLEEGKRAESSGQNRAEEDEIESMFANGALHSSMRSRNYVKATRTLGVSLQDTSQPSKGFYAEDGEEAVSRRKRLNTREKGIGTESDPMGSHHKKGKAAESSLTSAAPQKRRGEVENNATVKPKGRMTRSATLKLKNSEVQSDGNQEEKRSAEEKDSSFRVNAKHDLKEFASSLFNDSVCEMPKLSPATSCSYGLAENASVETAYSSQAPIKRPQFEGTCENLADPNSLGENLLNEQMREANYEHTLPTCIRGTDSASYQTDTLFHSEEAVDRVDEAVSWTGKDTLQREVTADAPITLDSCLEVIDKNNLPKPKPIIHKLSLSQRLALRAQFIHFSEHIHDPRTNSFESSMLNLGDRETTFLNSSVDSPKCKPVVTEQAAQKDQLKELNEEIKSSKSSKEMNTLRDCEVGILAAECSNNNRGNAATDEAAGDWDDVLFYDVEEGDDEARPIIGLAAPSKCFNGSMTAAANVTDSADPSHQRCRVLEEAAEMAWSKAWEGSAYTFDANTNKHTLSSSWATSNASGGTTDEHGFSYSNPYMLSQPFGSYDSEWGSLEDTEISLTKSSPVVETAVSTLTTLPPSSFVTHGTSKSYSVQKSFSKDLKHRADFQCNSGSLTKLSSGCRRNGLLVTTKSNKKSAPSASTGSSSKFLFEWLAQGNSSSSLPAVTETADSD